MPRVPVITTAVVVMAAAMLIPLTGVAAASAPLIHSVSQLDGDRGVRKHREMYAALSGANMIYDKCGQQLDISDVQQEYLKKKFADVSKAYVIAYQDAYVTYTQASPPQSFMNDVVAALTKRQQDAVDSIALLIRQRGCTDGRLRPIVKYVDALRKQDKKLQNIKPAEPVAPYQ